MPQHERCYDSQSAFSVTLQEANAPTTAMRRAWTCESVRRRVVRGGWALWWISESDVSYPGALVRA